MISKADRIFLIILMGAFVLVAGIFLIGATTEEIFFIGISEEDLRDIDYTETELTGGSIEDLENVGIIWDYTPEPHTTEWYGNSNKPALSLQIKDGKPVFTYDDIDEAGQALMNWINKQYVKFPNLYHHKIIKVE